MGFFWKLWKNGKSSDCHRTFWIFNNTHKYIIYKLIYHRVVIGICNYTDDLLKPLSLDPNQFHIWKIRCGISHLFSTNLQTLCISYKRHYCLVCHVCWVLKIRFNAQHYSIISTTNQHQKLKQKILNIKINLLDYFSAPLFKYFKGLNLHNNSSYLKCVLANFLHTQFPIFIYDPIYVRIFKTINLWLFNMSRVLLEKVHPKLHQPHDKLNYI